MPETQKPEKSEQVVVVKSWHIVILLLTLIIGATLSYGKLQDQSDEHARRIQDLERRPVLTLQEYENYQHGIEQRLDRIERKLDQEQARNR